MRETDFSPDDFSIEELDERLEMTSLYIGADESEAWKITLEW